MEIFLIYVVTRLTELKGALGLISFWSGFLVALAFLAAVLNEFLTEPDTKKVEIKDGETPEANVYYYQGVRKVSRRGLWFFTPVFVIVFTVNLFLPTTRDALVIAGGYGLMEAVSNERVQRLFGKSAQVAQQWLDSKLNDTGDAKKDDKKPDAKADASKEDKPTETADSGKKT